MLEQCLDKVVEITTLYVISLFELSNSSDKKEAIADFNYAKLRLVEAHNTYNIVCNHYKLDKYKGFDDDFAIDFFDAITKFKLKKKER
mgnify:FL=1